MFNASAHLHTWLCNASLSYSLSWYHLPPLHQKLPVNLCCDWDLDLIPVLLPTFAVTVRLLPWSASCWNHTKGFTSSLKHNRCTGTPYTSNTAHHIGWWHYGHSRLAGCLKVLQCQGSKRVQSRYRTEVTLACHLLVAWQVTEHRATTTVISTNTRTLQMHSKIAASPTTTMATIENHLNPWQYYK